MVNNDNKIKNHKNFMTCHTLIGQPYKHSTNVLFKTIK